VHTTEEKLAEDELPTDTPTGRFRVLTKMPCRHMGNGKLTSDPLAYELPGVPWTMIFHEWGVALHGAYWHDNFGTRMSHGCVNLRPADALWLFRWTDPVYVPGEWATQGRGTWIEIS
jgi:lipoprotein-anchoring transpeptidase ErfK/SrfK